MTDAPEAHDADGQVAELPTTQRLPRPLTLQLEKLGQSTGDGQQHHHHVFGDRRREDAAGVRDGQATRAREGRDHLVDPRREGVQPAQLRRVPDQVIEGRCAHPAAQQHLGLLEGRGLAVDAAVGGHWDVAHALDRLDALDLVGRQGSSEDRGGQDGDLAPAQRWSPSMRATQRGGSANLIQARQPVGALPDPVQEGPIARRNDRLHEALAGQYCSIFRSSPVIRMIARSTAPRRSLRRSKRS